MWRPETFQGRPDAFQRSPRIFNGDHKLGSSIKSLAFPMKTSGSQRKCNGIWWKAWGLQLKLWFPKRKLGVSDEMTMWFSDRGGYRGGGGQDLCIPWDFRISSQYQLWERKPSGKHVFLFLNLDFLFRNKSSTLLTLILYPPLFSDERGSLIVIQW